MNRSSIRYRLMISILCACLIPFVLGSLFIQYRAQKWSNSYAVEKSSLLLQQTAQRVDDSVLKNMDALVDLLVNNPSILNVDDSVNNFVEFDPTTFVYSKSESQIEIESYFEQIAKSYDLINLVSFGTEQGGYIEYPKFEPENPYDPRVRPWYMNAIDSSEAVVSEPYMTKESKELVFSIDKRVTKDGILVGVVSLTISLKDLMNTINEIPIGDRGYINVLSPSNVFVSCPQHEEWLMKSTNEIETDVFRNVDFYNNHTYEAELDGVKKVINVYISPYSGWKYVLVMDKAEIFLQSSQLSHLLLLIILIIVVGVTTAVILISNRITKPILLMSDRIEQMSTFRFDKYESSNETLYADQKDEIGIIARALNRMEKSFLELKSFMSEIDQKIDRIEIENKEVKEMSLSDDNPFKNMENSINGLLQKIYEAINQVHHYNHEIVIKNEQLVNSEEKLLSQVEEIKHQREFISFLAEHDPLTNLPNRRKFNKTLKSELAEHVQGAIFLLDLDNFKSINDTLGHLFGDKVLNVMSGKLLKFENESVFISRFGGDEFLMLYKNYKSLENLNNFILSIYEEFKEGIKIDKYEVKIEFSIGVSLFPDDSEDIDQLIMNADLALYSAKNNGKKSFAYYNNELGDVLVRKLYVKGILSEAIDADGFKLVYQPQVDIMSGEVIGYEALLRLKNEDISAGEFIAVAEEYGQIISIGRIVTEKVIKQLSAWQENGVCLKPVAINFSAHQMLDTSYKDFLFEILEENNIEPTFICIEITESIFLENESRTIEFLNELRKKGIKIAVDDFGTGYSSLSYLTFLPIDTLKLDRQLCIKFLEFENLKVMDSLIALAHSLKFKVIAEGIEEVDQVKRLIVGRCDAIQGYYYSRPLDPEAALEQHEARYSIFQDNTGSKFVL